MGIKNGPFRKCFFLSRHGLNLPCQSGLGRVRRHTFKEVIMGVVSNGPTTSGWLRALLDNSPLGWFLRRVRMDAPSHQKLPIVTRLWRHWHRLHWAYHDNRAYIGELKKE